MGTRKALTAIAEGVLWIWLLLCAYGQRDSWRDNNWWYFCLSSALGAVVMQLLRNHIKTPTPEPHREQA